MGQEQDNINKKGRKSIMGINNKALRARLYTIIFGTDTPAGKRFDIVLIAAILISVIALMAESVNALGTNYGAFFRLLEWVLTILFTLEYFTRIYCSPYPARYARSFYGIVDLLAIFPTYLSLIIPGANYLLAIRLLRFLRIFRVLKLVRYLREANTLLRSIALARRKISVFFFSVLVLAVILGTVMYVIEGSANGFSSIPRSIYWTIVTITTVGYGDITPQTVPGQVVASFIMLLGYSIIAVPTGILTAELMQEMQRERVQRSCAGCGIAGHERDARFCKVCGTSLSN